MAYLHKRTLTINHAKCGTADSLSFPLLFSGVYAYLAHTTYDGDVTDLNGFDIIFTSDSAGTVTLDHEIESYDPETGTCVFWVRVPTLSHSVDTVIYLWYGNAEITTSQEHITGVWVSHFNAVYHHATILGVDSAGANDLGGPLSGDHTLVIGKFGNGISVNGGSRYTGSITFPSGSSARTYSKWIKLATGQTDKSLGAWGDNSADGCRWGYYVQTGKLYVECRTRYAGIDWSQDTEWHLWHSTLPASGGIADIQIYKDGLEQVITGSAGTVVDTLSNYFAPGEIPITGLGGNFAMDEERISDIDRGADWILAEFNNQSEPATFYALGNEGSGSRLAMFLR